MGQGKRYHVYMKLDPVKVEWIVRQKEKGIRNATIAGSMKVCVRRVQRLWSAYSSTGAVPVLKRPGRRRVDASEEEKDPFARAYGEYKRDAFTLKKVIDVIYLTHILHNRIHGVMKSMGMTRDEPRKQLRRKWVRYERKYSTSLWHTDWTLARGRGSS